MSFRSVSVRTAAVTTLIGAGVVIGAASASAADAPAYPPVISGQGVDSTVSVSGSVQTAPVAESTATPPGGLAYTGADVTGVGVVGGALVLLGAGAVVVSRKRRA